MDMLNVSRIDHGVRCTECEALTQRLIKEDMPLTLCPQSNVRLNSVQAYIMRLRL